MDPICHTFVGASLAGTRLGRSTRGATATLLIAANLPDVDVASMAWGQGASLAFRRGWTHGVLALVVLPPLLALAVRWWHRRRHGTDADLRTLVGLSYLGCLTHPALDWLNTYGMRWLMPFDGTWTYGDTLYIVDPWLWLLLGGGAFLRFSTSRRSVVAWIVAAVMLSVPVLALGLVPSGAKLVWIAGLLLLGALRLLRRADVETGRLACLVALVSALVYIAGMFGARTVAHSQIATELDRPKDFVFVGPLPARVAERDVLLLQPHDYVPGVHRLGYGLVDFKQPIAIDSADLRTLSALTADCSRGFTSWLRFPYFVLEPQDDGGVTVHVYDARYVREPRPGFGSWRVRFDSLGEVVDCGA